MAIPSPDIRGVETGWQAPKPISWTGEGTVQTTNSKEAAKVEVVSITGWSQVRSLSGPPMPVCAGKIQILNRPPTSLPAKLMRAGKS